MSIFLQQASSLQTLPDPPVAFPSRLPPPRHCCTRILFNNRCICSPGSRRPMHDDLPFGVPYTSQSECILEAGY